MKGPARSQRSRSRAWLRAGLLTGLIAAGPALHAAPPEVAEGGIAAASPSAAGSGGDAAAPAALEALGRAIYFEGVGLGGRALQAHLSQGQVVEGSAAACVSCHRRSGQGGQEGRILVPPITAEVLFHDGVFAGQGEEAPGERSRFVPQYASRHAYDVASLQRAVHDAIDPEQRPLHDPMPRYALAAQEWEALLHVLTRLGAPPPGARSDQLEFWLVLTADADPRRRAAVRGVVEAFAAELPAGSLPWRVRVLDLAARPDALRDALAGASRPFALLSGAGGQDWSEVEAVCEREGIPCVFPSLALTPPRPESGLRYSQYLSEGLALEARAVAQRVDADPNPACRTPVILNAAGAAAPGAGSEHDPSAPSVESSAYRRSLDALRAALPQAELLDVGAVAARHDRLRCVVAWLPLPDLREAMERHPAPGPGTVWRAPLGLLPLRGLKPPMGWSQHLELVGALDPDTPLRFRSHLQPWLARHGLSGLDERSAADALAACTATLKAIASAQAERTRGMRRGPLGQEEFIEALEEGLNLQHVAGIDHYRAVRLGRLDRLASRSAFVLAFPTADAPEPRMVTELGAGASPFGAAK